MDAEERSAASCSPFHDRAELEASCVHVWLCAEDQEMIEARHRDFFAEHGVQFHETDNIGPHKKWLPLIESGHETPFVIADDDTYYPRDWFEGSGE